MVLVLWGFGGPAQAQAPVVHAVLFFSPTCPHCEMVIAQHLIPLQERFGDSLVIIALDTGTEYGGGLFEAAMDHYLVPRSDWGVPLVIVGDQIMFGSLEIPDRLPGLIADGLAGGGIDLPDFPALIAFLDIQGALRTIEPGPRYVYQDPVQATPDPEVQPLPSDTAATQTAARPEATSQPVRPTDAPVDSDRLAGAAGDSTVGASRADDATAADDPEAGDPAADESRADNSTAGGSPGEDPPGGHPSASDFPAIPGSASDALAIPGSVPDGPQGADSLSTAAATIPLVLDAARDPPRLTVWDRFARDRAGNTLAVLVLAGMVVAMLASLDPRRPPRKVWPEWVTPALVGVGMVVALYLSYVEVTGNPATCGPIGDCNTVQQSSYAHVFGIVPIGVLGVVGYLGVLSLWTVRKLGPDRFGRPAALGLWAFCLLGTGFSAYLTFLEPFVIGATCMWCLTSAVVMTLLLLASLPPASRSLAQGRRGHRA